MNNRQKSLAANGWLDPMPEPTFDDPMPRIVYKFLVALMVVALMCGNLAAGFAETSEHLGSAHHATPNHAGAHHQSHTIHHAPSLYDRLTVAEAPISLSQEICPTGEHHGGDQCCHVHAHWCLGHGLIPLGMSCELHADTSSKLTGLNHAPSRGSLVHPLLRPPRRMA